MFQFFSKMTNKVSGCHFLIFVLVAFLTSSCSVSNRGISGKNNSFVQERKITRFSPVELLNWKDTSMASLADSILAYALDHEALYTLCDTLKPLSSVKLLRYPLGKDQLKADGSPHAAPTESSHYEEIKKLQGLCEALSWGDVRFIIVPFKVVDNEFRNMEIYAVRKSVFNKTMQRYASFFGQWGFVPSSDPAVVLTAIEFEQKLDRFRAYGHLFGYPTYAVDFFVAAAQQQDADSAKKLVPRDFFPIPVFAGHRGYFTYAIPKGQAPQAVDTSLLFAASQTLELYKKVRPQFVRPTGLAARALWIEMLKQSSFLP